MLTLRKAIESLDNLSTAYPSRVDPGEYDALRLGKEGLIRLSNMRINPNEDADRLLPGEEK